MNGDMRTSDLGTYRGRRQFLTTNWSLVVQASDSESNRGAAALEELCRNYWLPLYSFARYRGLARSDAEDLTQSFFEDLLARDGIARADAERGRFRAFLLSSFKNHHHRKHAAARRQKRGGGKTILSLEALEEEESYFRNEPSSGDSPEQWYDRQWAADLVTLVLEKIRSDYQKAGNAALFEALKDGLWSGSDRIGYADTARRLDMREGAVRVAVYRLRRRFAERLRKEVAKTVIDPEEVDDEIRYLLSRVSA